MKVIMAEYEQARVHLIKAVEFFSRDITFKLKNKTTNNYNEFKLKKRLEISREGNRRTIYRSVDINQKFRAWHDTLHLTMGLSFSLEDETKVASEHRKLVYNFLRESGVSDQICKDAGQLIYLDIAIQGQWYKLHKMVVYNQEAFIIEYMIAYLRDEKIYRDSLRLQKGQMIMNFDLKG